MSLIDKLFESKWGKKLIRFLKTENKLLQTIDFGFIDDLAERQKKSKRGKKKRYTPSQLFKLCIEAFQKGRTSAKAIERYVHEPFVKIVHELKGYVSHDVLSRFFILLQGIVHDIFLALVQEAKRIGLLHIGATGVVDGTDLPTEFRSDKDAKWNYDSTAKQFYFGYGVLINVDPATHLPVAGMLTAEKKVSTEECKNVLGQTLHLKPSTLLGDGEFDMSRIHLRTLLTLVRE